MAIKSKGGTRWYPLIPNGYNEMNYILGTLSSDSRILVVDDIDCDGLLSAYIIKHSLCDKFPNIDIHINDKHGFTEDVEQYIGVYDLIIIVDSSSSLVENYRSNIPIIVIDHHEYNRNLTCPDNVIIINSKDTPGLESISAGMLCYLLMKEYTSQENLKFDDRLFSLGATTLYSDVVPVDEYVRLCLEHLIDQIKEDKMHPLLNNLNSYCNPMSKSVLSFNIIPSINYTRKIQDKLTINMIYRNVFPLVNTGIATNSSYVKSILEFIVNRGKLAYQNYNEFVWQDITEYMDSIDRTKPLKNFKGLVANQLQNIYRKPALVVYENKESKKYEISFRSEGYNSHSFITKYGYEGGGHIQACGCRCKKEDLEELLKRYENHIKEEYNKVLELDIEKICKEQLNDIDFYSIAYSNEYRFSNKKPKRFKIDVTKEDIGNIDKRTKKFEINGTSLTCYKMATQLEESSLDEAIELILTPTVDSHILETYNLIAERII